MKAIIFLAAVGAILVGCRNGAEVINDTSPVVSVSDVSVSGTYAAKVTSPNGDVTVIFAEFSYGKLEVSSYKFPLGLMTTASFAKWTSDDFVFGNLHTTTLTDATCWDGITSPTPQEFLLTELDGDKIRIRSSGATTLFTMEKVESVDQALSDLGMDTAIETTNCSATF